MSLLKVRRSWLFSIAGIAIGLMPRAMMSSDITFFQTNLTSDVPGLAMNTDANLANSWGIAFSSAGPFWVADNHTGLSTVYNSAGQPFPLNSPLAVTIPPAPGGELGSPTGIVFNGGAGFELSPKKPALFLFATEDGTISGWNGPSTGAVLKVDNSANAVYKGLAIASNDSGTFLYAANFKAGTIDVFNSSFQPTSVSGAFQDSSIPAGFAPFNVQNIDGSLYVTYAKQNEEKHDDVAGPGNGFVDVFDTNGNRISRLISNGPLNSPWGIVVAPSAFGSFGNDLLVGNFGDGTINAFNPSTGAFVGQLQDGAGHPISIEGLWALKFGNGGLAGDSNTLFFTAGISGGGNLEDHGLFGELQPVPEPGTIALVLFGLGTFAWLRRRGGSERDERI